MNITHADEHAVLDGDPFADERVAGILQRDPIAPPRISTKVPIWRLGADPAPAEIHQVGVMDDHAGPELNVRGNHGVGGRRSPERTPFLRSLQSMTTRYRPIARRP
jgi:hypothetical protein